MLFFNSKRYVNKDFFRKIEKVFIISSGRTGTKFFGENLRFFAPNSISVHEPDKVSFKKKEGLKTNIKNQGIFDVFFLKALGVTGARNLSLQALNNDKQNNRIIERFLYSRRWVKDCHYYFESNAQLFGLPSLLSSLPKTKIVIIFRDPRSWVRSWMNKGYWYDSKDNLTKWNLLGMKRLTPENVGQSMPRWENYSRFEKLCWVWNYMNEHLYQSLEPVNVNSFKFEDIFVEKNIESVRQFFAFILEDCHTENYVNKFFELSEKKVNQTIVEKYPPWKEWPDAQCKVLSDFCGDLMLKLGYGFEQDWQEKINGS